jgi:glyoxylase-like metal-dependent hydrolase (beta-lactamase superfamily II)
MAMRVTPLIASEFRSDGGTMFGLVPRTIWSKRIPPDDLGRIPQHAHSLLLELDDGRVGLVDTGCGPDASFSDKEKAIHGLGPGWPLAENLARRGRKPSDIGFVIFTHLHWDHGGGAVAPTGSVSPLAFPGAAHYVHELEWRDATSRDPLLYKSYPPGIVEALGHADLRTVSDAAPDILPGIRLLRSSGHTRGHSVVFIEGPGVDVVHPATGQSLVRARPPGFLLFAGDVCPTQHHLRMVFQTSYDTFPLDTRSWKRTWLPKAADEGALLLFDHDPDLYGALLCRDPEREIAVLEPFPART